MAVAKVTLIAQILGAAKPAGKKADWVLYHSLQYTEQKAHQSAKIAEGPFAGTF